MFEKTLEAKIKKIFQIDRVRFDAPGESKEQETIFIEVDKSRNHFKDGRYYARVDGRLIMFAQSDKFPFGYFSKAIEASPDDTKDLFFYDFEGNERLEANIVQRSVAFVYFFNSQYDPALGNINSVSIEVNT